jgi:hypothetical protein
VNVCAGYFFTLSLVEVGALSLIKVVALSLARVGALSMFGWNFFYIVDT